MGIEEILPDDCREKQYQQINKCYDCGGYEVKCIIYKQQSDLLGTDIECMQSGTIRNDLKKIKQGLSNITYPVLYRILEERK